MTLIECLERHAAEQPDSIAFTFRGEDRGLETLTFSELRTSAQNVAASLVLQGAPGSRVLLMFNSGLEFISGILGCFMAGAVAVPVAPLRHSRELPRVLKIAADSGASLVLTTSAIRSSTARLFLQDTRASNFDWLCIDTIPSILGESFEPEIQSPTSPAFLQYTSGSTGTPKGVIVSHANLVHNQQIVKVAFKHDHQTVFAGWLPFYHDMGLIGNVFHPLYLGIPSHLMPPVSFLTSPAKWLRMISDTRATTSGGPSFAYQLCVERVTDDALQGVDLSSWNVAFNGAEPVRASIIDAFAERFARYGFRREAFYPCYGMAEATLFIAGGQRGRDVVALHIDPEAIRADRAVPQADSKVVVVGCGNAEGQDLRIVDPVSMAVLAEDLVGEIWVAGPSIACGYWNQSQASKATFEAHTACGAGPFLRTGDLGFVREGELFVTGRLKDLIIVRGRNHYPDDIEATACACHDLLHSGGAAAFTLAGDDEACVVVVAELQRTALAALTPDVQQELLNTVRRAVAEMHGLRVNDLVLIRPATLPRTTSGKVRRSLCRQLYESGELKRAEPRAVARPLRAAAPIGVVTAGIAGPGVALGPE